MPATAAQPGQARPNEQGGVMKALAAGFFGTFWLVFGGCGSAVLAAAFPELGIGFAGVSLAFGLTVLTMAYAVSGISGGHFNPAVSLGLAVARRFAWKQLPGYWIAQLAGAIVAAAVLFAVATGKPGFEPGGFASNGFVALSPGGYGLQAALLMAIGLALTLIHLVSIPVTNTSVNPARSTGAALFAETAALPQLWLFWVAPLVGAVLGALIWSFLLMPEERRT